MTVLRKQWENRDAPDDYKLMAALFVMDTTYRFVQLDSYESSQVVWRCDIVPVPSDQL